MRNRKSLNQILKIFYLEMIFVHLMVIITFIAQASIAQDDLLNVVLEGDLEAARVLIEDKGVDVNAEINSEGLTVLMEAVSHEDIRAVRFLINARAKLDLQDKKGVTALMRAVMKGNIEMVRVLVNAGADVMNIRDENNLSALGYASTKSEINNIEIIQILLNGPEDRRDCSDALSPSRIIH